MNRSKPRTKCSSTFHSIRIRFRCNYEFSEKPPPVPDGCKRRPRTRRGSSIAATNVRTADGTETKICPGNAGNVSEPSVCVTITERLFRRDQNDRFQTVFVEQVGNCYSRRRRVLLLPVTFVHIIGGLETLARTGIVYSERRGLGV